MSQNGLSFTLRFIIGVAALGVALLVVNQAAGFLVPVLLAWVIVLTTSWQSRLGRPTLTKWQPITSPNW